MEISAKVLAQGYPRTVSLLHRRHSRHRADRSAPTSSLGPAASALWPHVASHGTTIPPNACEAAVVRRRALALILFPWDALRRIMTVRAPPRRILSRREGSGRDGGRHQGRREGADFQQRLRARGRRGQVRQDAAAKSLAGKAPDARRPTGPGRSGRSGAQGRGHATGMWHSTTYGICRTAHTAPCGSLKSDRMGEARPGCGVISVICGSKGARCIRLASLRATNNQHRWHAHPRLLARVSA